MTFLPKTLNVKKQIERAQPYTAQAVDDFIANTLGDDTGEVLIYMANFRRDWDDDGSWEHEKVNDQFILQRTSTGWRITGYRRIDMDGKLSGEEKQFKPEEYQAVGTYVADEFDSQYQAICLIVPRATGPTIQTFRDMQCA